MSDAPAPWRQPPPNAIQLELVEGCPLACTFCGINGIRARRGGYKFMSLEVLVHLLKLVRAAGWPSRWELAMHGEPTMHPHLVTAVEGIRRALPAASIMLTTNGIGLVASGAADTLRALFRAGLNCLAVDCYKGNTAAQRVIDAVPPGVRVRRYPDDGPTASPYQRRAATAREVIVLPDIAATEDGVHATLNNHCGCGAPLDDSAAGKRCALPFRELAVRHDGRVSICCNDFRGVIQAGDLRAARHIDDVWQSPVFQAARRMLYAGRREFAPCRGCNARSYKVGLLPDPRGVTTMDPPSPADVTTLERATAAGPMTLPVLRPWELTDG